MKVLHVIGCYLPATEWGGSVAAVANLVEAGAAAGIASEVFTTTQRSSTALAPIEPGTRALGSATVTWFRSVHALGRGFVAPGLGPGLRRRVRDFDLVHIHMLWSHPSMAAARACRAAGVPYVVTPHGLLDPWALRQRALEKRLFLALAERRNLERAALVHFTAAAEHAAAPEWVRELPHAVVPLAVDAGPFLKLGDPAEREGSHEVLILGRIHKMKGFDVLVPAMKQVLASEPRARLVVAGPDEGGYLAKVRSLAARNGISGAVELTGLLDAAGRARVLSRAAMVVAPSYRENFCLSVAEAMAAGLPVVVSDKVNICDDIAAAGAGRVIPVAAPPLAEAIVELLRDRAARGRMGAAGRRLVLERYSPGSVGASLRAAYARALGGGGREP